MRNLSASNRLLFVLLAAFVVALLVTAYLAFSTVRDVVLSWQINTGNPTPDLPALTPGPAPVPAEIDPEMPWQMAAGPPPQAWDGVSRITILLLGLDLRDWEVGGAPRTDTMMLVTLDPVSRSAGLLSIPRDLWVTIPGFQAGKINTAYQLGELYAVPGGGPALAMETVEGLLGVPVDFYAQIDFNAFVQFVDEIGGVKLDVPYAIDVDPLGPGNHKFLEPGVQTLPGDVALAYARARNTEGGDFDRAERQQQVMIAIRDRILSFDLLPALIASAPALYAEISGGIHTNLNLDQAIKIAVLANQVPPENIRRAVIGPNEVNFSYSMDGQSILIPLPDQIRVVRDEVFAVSANASPYVSPANAGKPLSQLALEEAARLAVYNGTTTAGLAAYTTEVLKDRGLQVIQTGNADQVYEKTILIDYTGDPYTLEYLIEILHVSPSNIYHSYQAGSPFDIEIFLGSDWAAVSEIP